MAQSNHHHLPVEAWSPWGNQGRLARTGIAHSCELGGSSESGSREHQIEELTGLRYGRQKSKKSTNTSPVRTQSWRARMRISIARSLMWIRAFHRALARPGE
jgi:hypothetical protein